MSKVPEEIEELAEDLGDGWWNYRFLEREVSWEDKDGKTYTDTTYELHEVYYNGKGEPWGWTERPMSVVALDYEDYKDIIESIGKAGEYPIFKIIKDGEDEKLIKTNKYIKDIKEEL